jgi:hypothetical protein
MAMGLTQPLTEMSTRNLPGGKGQLVHMADNLTAICEPIIYKMCEPRRRITLWASTACHIPVHIAGKCGIRNGSKNGRKIKRKRKVEGRRKNNNGV